jgi:hypothetical protein
MTTQRPAAESGEQPPPIASTRFEILAPLGRGASGIVHRVRDRETGSELALKTLSSPDADEAYHLKAEFRSLAQISHPNLVQLEELFVSKSECFFTMELLQGSTFAGFAAREGGPSGARVWSTSALERLTDVVLQLVTGISALHSAGKLHRDIKPSNVVVTDDGRAVLVDFGLCSELRLAERARGRLVGTLLYMAPDQAWAKPLTPAADWYALGAILYEALVGRLPFGGEGAPSGSRILFDKDTPPPVPEVGGILAELAAALLHPDPARRPDLAAILERLRPADAIPRSQRELRAARPALFVGREAELAVLETALAEVKQGRPAVVDVRGASGMGKSELVEHFVSRLGISRAAVVFRGRCHPQESVSYNGFDGIIDELSEWLRELTDTAIAELLPTDVGALRALFPVLGRIEAVAQRAGADEAGEPLALRQRAFRALRELFARVGERHTVVLTIDDLQWGGADTIALLTEVLRAPHMPRVLLVLAYRGDDEASESLLRAVRERSSDLLDSVHQLSLGPIDRTACCELAAHLLGDGSAETRITSERIADEAGGHPLYLRELALAATESFDSGLASGGAPPDLGILLEQRIDRLDKDERRLVDLASTAGRPVLRRVILAAAGPGERGRQLITRLARQRLLRETISSGEQAVEPYHSRVREAALGALGKETRAQCHRALADTLLRDAEPDVDSLVDHLLGAGDLASAGRFAETAAARADRALAFDRAVHLYRLAIDLTCAATPDTHWQAQPRSDLRTRLAAALANVGSSREAAAVYAEAAADAALDAPDTRADLERQSAEHYLRAGDLAEGFARMRNVLAAAAVPYPSSAASAVATMIGLRTQLAVRGLELRPRPAEARTPARLARVDACWSAGLGHAWIDPIRTAAFQARYMLLALDAGEPTRIARGLATEASQLAAVGGSARTDRGRKIMTRALRMTEASDSRESRAFALLMAGTVEFYASRYRDSLALCERAERILEERRSQSQWELMTSHVLSLAALAYLGELRTLRARQTELLAEARHGGNLLAAICLASGIANLRWLAADDPDEAQHRTDESIAPWKDDEFRFPQYLHLLACVNISLYRGDAAGAWRRLTREWPRVLSSMSMQVQNFRVTLCHLRARCALALATSADTSPSWAKREGLLLVARRDARLLAKEDVAWASALALSIEGGVAAATKDVETATRRLMSASGAYARLGMHLHAAAADHERSELLGGDEGRALLKRAERWMVNEHVVRSERLAATLIPGVSARR